LSCNLTTTWISYTGQWKYKAGHFFFLRGFAQIVSSTLLLCLLKLDLGYFNFVIGERSQRRYFVNNCESAKPSCNFKLRWRGKFEQWSRKTIIHGLNAGTELRSFIADKGACARSSTLTATLLLTAMPNVELFMRRTKL